MSTVSGPVGSLPGAPAGALEAGRPPPPRR